jgi:hypothetical protein
MMNLLKQHILFYESPFYYSVSRCLRYAFQCSQNLLAGKSFQYGKDWLADIFKHFIDEFIISNCTYAVIHNHMHTAIKDDHKSVFTSIKR